MSKGLNIIYLSNINSKEWLVLSELCQDKLLNREDIILLKVYFILLGLKTLQNEQEF